MPMNDRERYELQLAHIKERAADKKHRAEIRADVAARWTITLAHIDLAAERAGVPAC